MKNVNKIQLLGYVGGEESIRGVEITRQDTGEILKVVSLSLCTTQKYKVGDELHEKNQWHRLVFWGKKGETIETYVYPGMPLFVTGRMEYRTYEKDGVQHYVAEVNVEDFSILRMPEREVIQEVTDKKDKGKKKKAKK